MKASDFPKGPDGVRFVVIGGFVFPTNGDLEVSLSEYDEQAEMIADALNQVAEWEEAQKLEPCEPMVKCCTCSAVCQVVRPGKWQCPNCD